MSNCILIDDYEGPQVYNEALRKARKPHVCCECREVIAVGALHEYVTGMWDGVWASYRTCARCVNVRTDFFRGWLFGQMVDDFYMAHGFDYRVGIPADFAPCGAPPSGSPDTLEETK